MKKQKLSISNFTFEFSGYGHYKVTFYSTLTHKSWSTVTHDMPLIDATKNSDSPKQVDLIRLKNICKHL
jgi:hypothetical protein